MNAESEHLLEKISKLDTSGQQHYPKSRKVYVRGSRSDLKVPLREISLTATETEIDREESPPIRVFDACGIYSDTGAVIHLRKGLPPIHQLWIKERNDTESLRPDNQCLEHVIRLYIVEHCLQTGLSKFARALRRPTER